MSYFMVIIMYDKVIIQFTIPYELVIIQNNLIKHSLLHLNILVINLLIINNCMHKMVMVIINIKNILIMEYILIIIKYIIIIIRVIKKQILLTIIIIIVTIKAVMILFTMNFDFIIK